MVDLRGVCISFLIALLLSCFPQFLGLRFFVLLFLVLGIGLTCIGAGTFAGADGSRQPTKLELGVAKGQGKLFAEYVQKRNWLAKPAPTSTSTEPVATSSEPVVAKREEPKPVEQQPVNEGVGVASEGVSGGNVEQEGQQQKKKSSDSGPCGLPKGCVIL